MNAVKTRGLAAAPLRRREILEIAGTIEDAKVAAIEALGATRAELEQARAWASGQNDVMGKEHRALSGRIAELFEILTADEDYGDEQA